ncbi:hypothetical protein [Pacificibacter sp. AS14]|uniref:hypothetical protein n=1 Tax=Pacificibacter sp. AS14 TaxID=3135785 RepID=UPI00316C7A35
MALILLFFQVSGATMLPLFAVRQVQAGIEETIGAALRREFSGQGKSRLRNTAIGTLLAILLQSSTAVILLAASFVSTGAFGFIPAMAAVVGADLGSAIVVQLFLLATKILKRSAAESILLAMSGVIANNAFYVLPIALQRYGPVSAQPFIAITALDALVGFSAVIIALGFVKQGKLSLSTLVSSITSSPVIIALALGLAFAATGWTMPASLETFISFNGAAAAPVALFALGVVLSQTSFSADPAVIAFTGVKLLLFPAAVCFGLKAVSYQADDVHIYPLTARRPSNTILIFSSDE